MKRLITLMASLIIGITAFLCLTLSSYAAQTTDIARTRIMNSTVYYSYSAASKTLIISGEGNMPDFTNSSGSSSSQPWFSYRSDGSIEHIVIEEGVTSLGTFAFYCCSANDVLLPSSLEKIGSYSLANLISVTSVDIPNGVTNISNNAFYYCTSLLEVYIPKTVKSIGNSAFEYCSSLESVEFGSSYMSVTIGRSAFLRCNSLDSLIIPRNARLSQYSIGYRNNNTGDTNSSLIISVYRDSAAYDYALANAISYTLLNEMEIYEGDNIQREFISGNISNTMLFYFTATSSKSYRFSSTGGVDVDCVLVDGEGNVISSSDDISVDNLNFSITENLTEGERYCFRVTSNNSLGEFRVRIMPLGVDIVEIDWDITISAVELDSFDIDEYISSCTVDFIYSSGYTYSIPFEDGGTYANMTMRYKKPVTTLDCGDNFGVISVGDNNFSFVITVEHSFVKGIVEPDERYGGYTTLTCVHCGARYICDYVDALGRYVEGRLVAMASPDGEPLEGAYIPRMPIFSNLGECVGYTDDDGCFSYDYAYDYILVGGYYGPARRVEIGDAYDLGDIVIVNCDFIYDGYVNAKDFAVFNTILGTEIDEEDFDDLSTIDINHNGVIDYGDWEYTKAFWTYGKIDETIYDNE